MPKNGNRPVDRSGQKFGYWTVLSYAGPRAKKGGGASWRCVCVCGVTKVVSAESLTRGKSKSCGCKTSEMKSRSLTKHGQSRTSTGRPSGSYSSWHAMRQRCENPNNAQFADYGGRGISVCPEWYDFRNFLSDMGDRPDGMTIDRIDPDGDYCPENCKWSTVREQAINKRPRMKHGDVLEIVGAARMVVQASNDNLPAAIQQLRSALSNLDNKAA